MLQTMKSSNYRDELACDEPFQRPSAMDQFDRLVLRAAKKKRKEIAKRYGDEGCSKILARKERFERTTPARTKSHFTKTIRELRESQLNIPKATPAVQDSDKDFDIDELFELAWGGDMDTDSTRETTNHDDDDDDIDALFERAWGGDILTDLDINKNNNNRSSTRKLLNVRESTKPRRSYRVRRTRDVVH